MTMTDLATDCTTRGPVLGTLREQTTSLCVGRRVKVPWFPFRRPTDMQVQADATDGGEGD